MIVFARKKKRALAAVHNNNNNKLFCQFGSANEQNMEDNKNVAVTTVV